MNGWLVAVATASVLMPLASCWWFESPCLSNEFFCSRSVPFKCISDAWTCDGQSDCPLGEDEESCSGTPQVPRSKPCQPGYKCRGYGGSCYYEQWKCDGDRDCPLGDDEENCPVSTRPPVVSTTQRTTPKTVFPPDAGTGPPVTRDVPAVPTTAGRSRVPTVPMTTQSACPQDYVCRNSSGMCIHLRYVCDGHGDCPFGDDEETCPEDGCPPGYFQCPNSKNCIDPRWRCDGEADCHGGEDELDCPAERTTSVEQIAPVSARRPIEVPCPGHERHFISKSYLCDGDMDCPGGTDEHDCEVPTTRRTTSPNVELDTPTHVEVTRETPTVSPVAPGPVTTRAPEHVIRDTSAPHPDVTRDTSIKYTMTHESSLPNKLFVSTVTLPSVTDVPRPVTVKVKTWPTVPPVSGVSVHGPGSTHPPCNPGHHQCRGYRDVCIPDSWLCDLERDCPNGDDEENCSDKTCSPGLFKCRSSNQCINRLWTCDGDVDCNGGDDEHNCTGPSATYTCSKLPTREGYVRGKTQQCFCKLNIPDSRTGHIEWQIVSGPRPANVNGGSISIHYDKQYEVQTFACRGYTVPKYVGNYTNIQTKFAFFDDHSVTLTPSVLTMCDKGPGTDTSTTDGNSIASGNITTTANSNNNNKGKSNLIISCQVPKLKVNPAPVFSFSVNGGEFDSPVIGEDTGEYYQRQLGFVPPREGRHFIKCVVSNPVFSDLQQETHKPVWVQAPPPQAPVLTVMGRNFQGTDNPVVTLPSPDSFDPDHDVTCSTKGGYPSAEVTHVGCVRQYEPAHNDTSTNIFIDKYEREVSKFVCSCRTDHASGCYLNSETRVTLVLSPVTTQETATTRKQTTPSGNTRTTESLKHSADDPGSPNSVSSSENSNNVGSHQSRLLHIFLIVCIVAVIIIVLLVVAMVAMVYRRRKYKLQNRVERGDSQKIIFSELSTSNENSY